MGLACSRCDDGAEAVCTIERIPEPSVSGLVDAEGTDKDPADLTLLRRGLLPDKPSNDLLDSMSTEPSNEGLLSQLALSEAMDEPERTEDTSVPPLGPVGCGGWPAKDIVVTEEMARLKEDTLRLFKDQYKTEMTDFNLEYLTSATLQNYSEGRYAPELLVNACGHRAEMEDKLNGRRPIVLNGSCRIVGWDGHGRTIVALEPCTMQASLVDLLDHFEYVFWNALDLNKPGVKGVVMVVDVGGGYNWKHFLSMHAMTEAVKLLKNCFHGQLAALYLVDMPSAFRRVFNGFSSFAEPETRQRIQCISGIETLVEALQELGVDCPTIEYFRSFMAQRRKHDRVQSWNPLVEVPFALENLPGLAMNTDVNSITAEHHKEFRQAVLQCRLHQWGFQETHTPS